MQQNLFDELGQWSIDKLKLLEKYLHAYTVILTKQSWCHGVHYIDAFAGAGTAIDRETQGFLDASPRVAVNTDPPFTHLAFIDKDARRATELERLQDEFPHRDIDIYQGDSNDIIVNKVIPRISRNERAFLLIDPYGMNVKWQTLELAARVGTFEVFINFPLMAIFRNVVRESPDRISPRQAQRLTVLWGSDGWMEVLYPDALLGPQKTQENTGRALSDGFRKRLRTVFDCVSDYKIMRNTKRAPVYSLIWAGHKDTALKIVNEVFGSL